MVDILSVGIDIGTSTTQLVFSRIGMENTTGYFAVPRVSIVSKEVVYRSAIYTTPLRTPVLLDGEKVRGIIAGEYEKAGFSPQDVDTGAVIITGESARKENAAQVLEKLSGFAGEFVVSTAGPDLESVIAGKGSGAYQCSQENGWLVANLDIGGGTTNIALFDSGETVGRCCFDIGGRQIRVNEAGEITYVSPSAARIAEAAGVRIAPGERPGEERLRRVTDKMADLLAQALYVLQPQPLLEAVRTAGSARMDRPSGKIRRLVFSGGVADCMDRPGACAFPYGDIGQLLADSLLRGALCKAVKRLRGQETIRATVVGAGSYTTSISGSTIGYDPALLPLKNVPALLLTGAEEEACFLGDAAPLARRIRWFLEQADTEQIALALRGRRDPGYGELKALAESLSKAGDVLPAGRPLAVILREDMAKALGLLLTRRLQGRRPVICIDGIRVEQGDYVDLGRPVMDGLVIPVVVKTLLFG